MRTRQIDCSDSLTKHASTPMCIIVDADRIGRFLRDPTDDDSEPIRRWIDRGGGVVVYATEERFRKEIVRSAKDRLAEYVRAGKARHIAIERFGEDVKELRHSGRLRSNDAHVLALARASGARLLYTGDTSLMDDFRDKALIDKPRGRIYSGAANRNLLTRSTCRM